MSHHLVSNVPEAYEQRLTLLQNHNAIRRGRRRRARRQSSHPYNERRPRTNGVDADATNTRPGVDYQSNSSSAPELTGPTSNLSLPWSSEVDVNHNYMPFEHMFINGHLDVGGATRHHELINHGQVDAPLQPLPETLGPFDEPQTPFHEHLTPSDEHLTPLEQALWSFNHKAMNVEPTQGAYTAPADDWIQHVVQQQPEQHHGLGVWSAQPRSASPFRLVGEPVAQDQQEFEFELEFDFEHAVEIEVKLEAEGGAVEPGQSHAGPGLTAIERGNGNLHE
ncbi:Uu.00g062620.m01.CDS01 [Anthostomella pinea]|uniref:Uu.00g062620.m01.CDS01 n=1 Tax=Anthostomella pinea TaxID=933095 RepID=A0AAI8YKI1_9PEZI|nr:Uu.00g062620.m01.CDS01 [Anthostomella pinea]